MHARRDVIVCDNCERVIPNSKTNVVVLELDGKRYTTDWCGRCYYALARKIMKNQVG